VPFPPAPGAHDPHFRIPLLTLQTLKFFSTSPPQFYAYREAVDNYLQRHPYSTTSTAIPTTKPGVADPIILPRLFCGLVARELFVLTVKCVQY